MNYLMFTRCVMYSFLSFCTALPMEFLSPNLGDTTIEINDSTVAGPSGSATNPDILLLTTDQIIDYIRTLGIDLSIIAQSIHSLDGINQAELSQRIEPILKVIENGFNMAAKKNPASINLNRLSNIAKAIGITPGKDLSTAEATFYLNALEKSLDPETQANHANPFETTINLQATHPEKIYPEIVLAVYKIVVNSLTQGKPFLGILVVHSPNTHEIIVAAAPARPTRRFDAGGGAGFAFKLPNQPVGAGNLGLAIGAAKVIDQELTELETDPNLSPACQNCIKKIHKPINILAALLVAAVFAFTFYTTFLKTIHGQVPLNGTPSS